MKSWIRYLSGNRTGHVVEVDESVASSETACGMAERCAPPAGAAAPSMKHVGGGWWELSNGRRYKGKAEALRALKRLGG